MRALRSHDIGGPETLTLDEVPNPVPGDGEILIAVRACALNYPDTLLIQDRYQIKLPRPFAPGSEVAGVVEAVGPGVTAYAPGDRVIGLSMSGGLAGKIVVPQSGCIAIASSVPFDEAAALMVTYATAHYALKHQAAIRAGETLLVLGASGGVGIAAIQVGKAYGAKVIAAVSSEEKAALVRSLGADAALVYPADLTDRTAARAFTEALRAEGNIHIAFDPVGGPYTEPAFRALGWEGRHLVVGFTAGIPSLPLNLTLLKGAQVIGVDYGGFCRRDPELRQTYLDEIAALHAAGRIKPHVSLRLPLARAGEGLALLGSRASTGKIVVEI